MGTPQSEVDLVKQVNQLKQDNGDLAAALHSVLCESEDPESVRTAVAALLGTGTGRQYLELHPLRF